jgi:hypothetical protein
MNMSKNNEIFKTYFMEVSQTEFQQNLQKGLQDTVNCLLHNMCVEWSVPSTLIF